MKTTLFAQPVFNFLATITTLQRGGEDPTNLIDNAVWSRCFQIKQNVVLLSTHCDEHIHIHIHEEKAGKQDVETLIAHCLGLDDPLLNQPANDLRLDASWGIAVPGYPSLFEALIQTLFGQLVSVPVANQMRRRFILAFGQSYENNGRTYYLFPEANDIAGLNEDMLRVVGTSKMKIRSILAVARAFVYDDLKQKLLEIEDREGQYRLLKALYGVGGWTIDWIMLRALRQFDIVPTTDLAVRKAITWWADADELLSEKETLTYTKEFSPYSGAMIYRILCAYVRAQHQQKLIV